MLTLDEFIELREQLINNEVRAEFENTLFSCLPIFKCFLI